MPRFEPFIALRYRDLPLSDVSAPPYDVLSPADRQTLADRHPNNIVHIDVPDESAGPSRYDHAADVLSAWIRNRVLEADQSPSFTIYRLQFNDSSGRLRSTVGVIGGLEVVDEGARGVLPHERTTPKAKTDRLDLTRATSTNLSPVWGLSMASGLSALLEAAGHHLGTVERDGVIHRFERVDDPVRVRGIAEHVGSADVVIADGHHRYAISRTFRDEQRATDTGTRGRAELTMAYVQELVESQLSVEAIHRLYTDVDYAALVTTLERSFDFLEPVTIEPELTRVMDDQGCLVLVQPDGVGVLLRPRPESFVGIRNLDGARLETALTDIPHTVDYQHGVQHVLELVRGARAVAGVLIRPVTVDEIQRTAREGLLMPPKSTFFTPKLLTGPVLRPMYDLDTIK